MALNKADLAARLLLDVGLNKREAKEFVDIFVDIVHQTLVRGERVNLCGFGSFDLRDKNDRRGRNPKTGEQIRIPSRRVVTFRTGRNLGERVDRCMTSGRTPIFY
jgi:integration host factor subunit alpha